MRVAAVAIAFALAAAVLAFAFFGFTVDDALITARYAAHLAGGAGYRFNKDGPVTDGVTPLGFAHLLAPFAGGGARTALSAAKAIGIAAWIGSAAIVGIAARAIAGRAGARAWIVAWGMIATSAPLAAWSVAGMETGIVTALAALAASLPWLGFPRIACACAGLAAAWRPELVPWAITIVTGLIVTNERDTKRPFAWIAFALVPQAIVAAIRFLTFGRLAPLSVFAKAPDARLGATYALACGLLTGLVLLGAPWAWRKTSGRARVLGIAVLVHFVAVAFAGGDWMPLSRLVVPVLPSLGLVGVALAAVAHPLWSAVRLALALAGQVFAIERATAQGAAEVGRDRDALIEALGPALRDAKVIASLDIGWVGAATPAMIVDLAGVTDPSVAALAGGHTTKRIPAAWLDSRRVDTIVLLLAPGEPLATPWTASHFARGVEQWIAWMPGLDSTFAPVAQSERPKVPYVVLRRIEAP